MTLRFGSTSDGRGPALSERIAQWADRNPKVRRVWATEADAVVVALELQPVGDSEETLALRLARGGQWHRELEQLFGRAVELEWLDPDEATSSSQRPLREADTLVYERFA